MVSDNRENYKQDFERLVNLWNDLDPKEKTAAKFLDFWTNPDNGNIDNANEIQKLSDEIVGLLDKQDFTKQEKIDIRKSFLLLNKSFITNTNNFLSRIKTADDRAYYNCNVFKQSNNAKKEARPLKIPRGTLSYIGAMTHRGKTTALISCTLDALKQNQKVYFITTEETADQVFIRMIKAVLYLDFAKETIGFTYKDTKNKYELDAEDLDDTIKNYLKEYTGKELISKEKNLELKEAIFKSYEQLNSYLSTGKFAIIDHLQHRNFDELINAIDLVENESLVILDYIQHVKSPSEDKAQGNRQVIIQGESQRLADIAAAKDLIIVSGGQFNRQGNSKEKQADKWNPDFLDPTLFRESGDIEQDAHLIIGIGQQLHEQPNAVGDIVTRFYEVLKQRGNPQDTQQYLIVDNAKFSLYNCDEYNKDNIKQLCFFTPTENQKKNNTKQKETGKEKKEPKTLQDIIAF